MSEKYYNIVVEGLLKETKINIFEGDRRNEVIPPMTPALNILPNILPFDSGISKYPDEERYEKGKSFIKKMYSKYMRVSYGVNDNDSEVIWGMYEKRLLEQL